MKKKKLTHTSDLTRRDFSRLAMAAFGGVVLGSTMAGCGQNQTTSSSPAGEGGSSTTSESGGGGDTQMAKADPSLLMEEPHVCRGLNTCKGKGKAGENACAGQGTCATVESHSCSGENACKGQGGCGETVGQNACKGQGNCAVPLSEEAWKTARQAFEQQMADAGKEVGSAPQP